MAFWWKSSAQLANWFGLVQDGMGSALPASLKIFFAPVNVFIFWPPFPRYYLKGGPREYLNFVWRPITCPKDETPQELRMLYSVTLNCQVTSQCLSWIQGLNCMDSHNMSHTFTSNVCVCHDLCICLCSLIEICLLITIPHICPFFYTTLIWGVEVLHLKVWKFYTWKCGSFTLESAYICNESCLAAKQRKLPSENSNHELCENYYMHVDLWVKLHTV